VGEEQGGLGGEQGGLGGEKGGLEGEQGGLEGDREVWEGRKGRIGGERSIRPQQTQQKQIIVAVKPSTRSVWLSTRGCDFNCAIYLSEAARVRGRTSKTVP